MAELVERHPDRFPAFVASLPMNNPDAALRETDRAIGDLGATGVQIFSNVNGAAARRAGVPADLRPDGAAPAPDLDAPGSPGLVP